MEVRMGGRDWCVEVGDGDATVADLARAAGLAPEQLGLPPHARLLDLGVARGAVLEPASAGPAGAVHAVVVGGLDAGRSVPLGPGRALVGRCEGNDVALTDPTVSRRHAALDVGASGAVAVRDLGSRNGTWRRGDHGEEPLGERACPSDATHVLRLGATELAIGVGGALDVPVCLDPPSTTGTSPHNRPPRPAPPPPPPAVPVPDPPDAPTRPVPLGLVGVLAPVVMAGLLVVLLGNPVFAALALLSPVVAVGNHVEGRRRTRRDGRAARRRRADELDRMADALAAAGAVEVARRRDEAPGLDEVVRRAAARSVRLWERRPGHDDFLRLRVGVGDLRWDPPLAGDRLPRADDVAALLAAGGVLPRCPATVDLAGGGVVGVVGDRSAALAVARSLVCQAAVHHGPADVAILVAVDEDAVACWEWAKWLPHVEDPAGGGRRLAAGRGAADQVVVGSTRAGDAALLLVVDGDELLAGRRSPIRALLAGPAAGVVVAATEDRLPAACTAVVAVGADGEASITVPRLGLTVTRVRADGVAVDTADRCARALARVDDPELDAPGAGLPDVVGLTALLELADLAPPTIAARWRTAGPDPRPTVPIGVAADGAVDLDLTVDGPHALVAGTTGSGKSELLRTLVAGLAVAADPDAITFVLVDFKGGSAFDACARLPHVVGLVTDLDDALAARALRCLEAELRHRERVLRATGSVDLAAHRRRAGADPLPRLVVVVDEFATLKAELPGFVDALVGIAQRGRSLGVHLVLATQRPAGAVSEHIRANTNLRIALRVQDAADSSDVIDVPDAAHLPRSRPGRACIRLGPGEVVAVQTALATTSAASVAPARVRVEPFAFGPGASRPRSVDGVAPGDGPTDLDRLVDACAAAWAASGRPAPRRPWPDPLPDRLDRRAIVVGDVALADDPDHQRRVPIRWHPADGNLAVFGIGGSGTTTTLTAVALSLAELHGPDRLHLYVVDHGAGDIAVLGGLPHTGAVIAASEVERQRRLVRSLRREVGRRRHASGGEPLVVVVLDGVAGFLAAFDGVHGFEVLDAFERVFADGPAVGVHVALAADRPAAVPSALASVVRHRWVHRLADAVTAGVAGVADLAGEVPSLPAGRFVDVASGLAAQVAVAADGWGAAVAACSARWAADGRSRTAPGVGELPAQVAWPDLAAKAVVGDRPWSLPVAIADDDLGAAELPLWEGDHVLVAGPGRSGRTTALSTIACAAAAADPAMPILAVVSPRSWLASVSGVTTVEPGDLAGVDAAALVLVDDADAVDDPNGVLESIAAGARPGVHLVAAGRAEVLRGLYGHWTRTVRRSRLGLLLRPDVDLDGDLLGTPLPRRATLPPVPGRGFLVADGVARLVQVATPT